MMRRFSFFVLVMSVAGLSSCSKAAAPQSGDVVPGKDEKTDVRQILIGSVLGVSEPVSKASVDAWAGQTLYAVGYDIATVSKATEITAKSGFVIPNEKGTAPYGTNPGMLTFPDGKQFYYEEGVQAYDFNGYYVSADSVITSPLKVKNGLLSLGIKIDGTQDILGATTDKEADRVIPDEYCEKYGYEKGSKVKIDYVYSAFAARRGVQPKLNFEHMLSKFTFSAKLGEYLEEGHRIHLVKLAVRSKPNGTFVLNPKNGSGEKINSYVTAASTDTVSMYLDCKGIVPVVYEPISIEGCVMVIPEEEAYEMCLYFTQDGTDGEVHKMTFPVNINNVTFSEESKKSDRFKAGKQYSVNIIVYGLQKIEVKVDLKQWDEAGTYEYDPDDIESGVE